MDKSGYPPSLKALVEGAVDKRDPKGAPHVLSAPRSAWTRSAAQRMGPAQLRQPRRLAAPGEDVYDVLLAKPEPSA